MRTYVEADRKEVSRDMHMGMDFFRASCTYENCHYGVLSFRSSSADVKPVQTSRHHESSCDSAHDWI